MAQILSPGTQAPDFTLNVTPDQKLSLSELRGHPVILAFYPADWSPGLRRPDGAVQRNPSRVPEATAPRLLGISVDGVWCHAAFAKQTQLAFPAARRLRAQGRRLADSTAPTAKKTASPNVRCS